MLFQQNTICLSTDKIISTLSMPTIIDKVVRNNKKKYTPNISQTFTVKYVTPHQKSPLIHSF